jgi:hypothetical protein
MVPVNGHAVPSPARQAGLRMGVIAHGIASTGFSTQSKYLMNLTFLCIPSGLLASNKIPFHLLKA